MATGIMAAAAPASAVVRTDDGGDVPFYARITTIGDPDQIFHDETWAAIVFYRPPSCVPKDFNLLDFFDFPQGPNDPGAFGCNPPPGASDPLAGMTTGGFNLWRNGPGIDPAPFLAVSHGLGAVPVWLVSWPALEAALAPAEGELVGVLTMGELEGLPRLVGSANYFHQVLEPHDAAVVPKTLFVARGSLEDGRSFLVRGLFVEGTTIRTDIDIR